MNEEGALITDEERVNLGHELAKLHQSATFIFWLRDDWLRMNACHLTRLNPEQVSVTVRNIGKGTLDIGPWQGS